MFKKKSKTKLYIIHLPTLPPSLPSSLHTVVVTSTGRESPPLVPLFITVSVVFLAPRGSQLQEAASLLGLFAVAVAVARGGFSSTRAAAEEVRPTFRSRSAAVRPADATTRSLPLRRCVGRSCCCRRSCCCLPGEAPEAPSASKPVVVGGALAALAALAAAAVDGPADDALLCAFPAARAEECLKPDELRASVDKSRVTT